MHIRFIRTLLLAGAILFLSTSSFAQVGVAITIAPPELPAYEQPVCPGEVISGRLGIGLGMVSITGCRARG
jgi:hypothetical protein